jgi:hypothetical protein
LGRSLSGSHGQFGAFSFRHAVSSIEFKIRDKGRDGLSKAKSAYAGLAMTLCADIAARRATKKNDFIAVNCVKMYLEKRMNTAAAVRRNIRGADLPKDIGYS